MKQRVHPIAGMVAMAMIAIFWLSTAISELSGSQPFITDVKTLIPWGFAILIPALAITGGSGFSLADGRDGGLIGIKKRRMKIIAANGIVVLAPAAFFLAYKAGAGQFDMGFYAVQAVELLVGAVNLWLLARNARDGLKMTTTRRRRKTAAT